MRMNGVVRYEGVTFVVAPCVEMGKDDFIKHHIDSFWTDRDKKTRRKMLTEAFALMTKND